MMRSIRVWALSVLLIAAGSMVAVVPAAACSGGGGLFSINQLATIRSSL